MRQFAVGFLVCLGTILSLGLLRCGGNPEVVRKPEPCPIRDAAPEGTPSALEIINSAIAQAMAVEVAAHEPDRVSLPALPECSDDLCEMPDGGEPRKLETLEREP